MRRRLFITLLIVLLAVVAVVVVKYWPLLFPVGQTSEVYRRYRDLPGIRAAYIRQMPINDTLRLDMTLFEAEDSLSYTNFLRTIGKREEYIRDIMSDRVPKDVGASGICRRGNLGSYRPDPDDNNNEITINFNGRFTFAVIHTRTAQELSIVDYKATFNEIDIDQR